MAKLALNRSARRRSLNSVGRPALVVGVFCLQACGGAAYAPAEPQTSDLVELERRLDQHQSELEGRFGALSPPADQLGAPASASPEAPEPFGGSEPAPVEPSPAPASAAEGREADYDEVAGEEREPLSACDVGCRALEGMRRAASRICELTGATSPQCERARARVGRADDRVTDSGCSC